MARIFVSHSSLDNAVASDIMRWLRANGFDETFLDIDKDTGIATGFAGVDLVTLAAEGASHGSRHQAVIIDDQNLWSLQPSPPEGKD